MHPLKCPLCCPETFDSYSSLKFHILSVADNLYCPSCSKKCIDLLDLANHIGSECGNTQNSTKAIASNKPSDIEKSSSKKFDVKLIKKEVEDDLPSNSANLNKDIKKEPLRHEKPMDNTDNHDEPQMTYTCEMCNMTFDSVQEHLDKYHEGEEVVLETEQDDGSDTFDQQHTNSMYLYQPQTDDDISQMFDDDGSIAADSMDDDTPSKSQETSLEDPLKISEDQNDNSDGSPIVTKYMVEYGKVVKLTEEDAKKLSDSAKIYELYKCPNCTLQFPKMDHFEKHNCTYAKKVVNKTMKHDEQKTLKQKMKEEIRYQCTFCLAIYHSLSGLNDHMKAHLIKDSTGRVRKKTITMSLHVCQTCNTKFPTHKQLRLHSRMHDVQNTQCVGPPVSYNIMGDPVEEEDESGNVERETFDCPVCEMSYDKQYEDVHMKYHAEEEPFICLVCNRKFDSLQNLSMHTKAHSNNKKFSCSYCKKSFNTYEALREHVQKQCQTRDFECQFCGRRFARPHEKVKHERIHTGEKPHVCEICGKSFRVAYCLTLHMRTHTGTRPYACDQCGKRFKSHGVFNHHRKTHFDERNYKCTFCPKTFKTAVQLAGHKNSHTKPFSCTECNRPFASLYAVRAHMETHKRDNNLKFECYICRASYARAFALRDHMSEAHGKPTEKVQDDQVLMEVEDGTQTEQIAEDGEDHQTGAEDGEYQEYQGTAGAETEMCEVLEENGDGEYVVQIQQGEGEEIVEEHQIE